MYQIFIISTGIKYPGIPKGLVRKGISVKPIKNSRLNVKRKVKYINDTN